MDSKKNAKEMPQVLYGLHFCEGLAEYSEPQVNEGKPYRLLIGEEVAKEMNPSFAGKPVYVRHVEQVDLDKLQEEAAGYVVESFFNEPDGKHWAKFIVVSDAGHEAIKMGWKLSNAYTPKEFGGGGKWHNVDYSKEVIRGEYEHLAIVPNPRYEESIILTPDQFKEYNAKKEQELKALKNSKGDRSMFNFFKKAKLENSKEIEETLVTLSNGAEKSIQQLINEAEEHLKKEDAKKHDDDDAEKHAKKDAKDEGKEGKEEMPKKDAAEGGEGKEEKKMAEGHHMVKVGDAEMTVNALVEKYQAMVEKHGAVGADEDKEAMAKAKEIEEHEKKEIKEKEQAKHNAKGKSHFDALKNAPHKAQETVVDLSIDQLARGRSRYGSGK